MKIDILYVTWFIIKSSAEDTFSYCNYSVIFIAAIESSVK